MIDKLFEFLKNVDYDFPVKLSDKTDLYELSEKFMTNGVVFYEEVENKIIALAAGYINNFEEKKAYISVVSTLKEYRGQGYAKKLIIKFLKKADEKGMKKVFLYTHKTNFSALEMYKKIGFCEIESDRPDSVKLFINL